MRHLTALLLLLAFTLGLPACAQKATVHKVKIKKTSQKSPVVKTQEPAKTAAGPVLTFERTPCNGRCPAYLMQVFADGRVAYEGKRDVPLMGAQELKLPASTVAEMLRTAQQAHFEQFDKHYSRGTSDMPSTIVAIRQPDGRLKTVTVEEGAPQNVLQYFTYLTNQFDDLAHTRTDR